MMENKTFYIQYQQNQPLKIESHYVGDQERSRALKDVADLIAAYKTVVAPRFDNTPIDEITLHQVVDGDESESFLPDLSLDNIFGGQSASDPLRITAKHETYFPTRMTLPVASVNLEKIEKQKLGEQFLKSIQQKPDLIPNSGGMYVLRNVLLLEAEYTRSIILRTNTEPFWNSVIATVDEQNADGRNSNSVCVVGTPGIGKTTTTPFLIRMLLQRKKTVVYYIRLTEGTSFYYEFTSKNDNDTTVTVYEESERQRILSLKSTDTYYIVDPGKTTDSCSKEAAFKPKLIIVSSPDERHWGGPSFDKRIAGSRGIFKYMPVWDAKEIINAAPFLSIEDPELLALVGYREKMEQEVIDRYRIFGGVPRLIFERKTYHSILMKKQDIAINTLTMEQAKLLFERKPQMVDNFKENQPRSHVIHYTSSGDSHFGKHETLIASDYIFEKVCVRFLSHLWDMLNGDCTGKILEAYLRYLLSQRGKLVTFEHRNCVGNKDKNYHNIESDLKLGGCHDICISSDPIASAFKYPMKVFYSYNASFPLFDLCYVNDEETRKKTLVLVQATTSQQHDAKKSSLINLVNKVKPFHVSVLLCYAVPCEKFINFVTNPRNPTVKGIRWLNIKHINVLRPA
jgi:Retrotransposon hot spot protein